MTVSAASCASCCRGACEKAPLFRSHGSASAVGGAGDRSLRRGVCGWEWLRLCSLLVAGVGVGRTAAEVAAGRAEGGKPRPCRRAAVICATPNSGVSLMPPDGRESCRRRAAPRLPTPRGPASARRRLAAPLPPGRPRPAPPAQARGAHATAATGPMTLPPGREGRRLVLLFRRPIRRRAPAAGRSRGGAPAGSACGRESRPRAGECAHRVRWLSDRRARPGRVVRRGARR